MRKLNYTILLVILLPLLGCQTGGSYSGRRDEADELTVKYNKRTNYLMVSLFVTATSKDYLVKVSETVGPCKGILLSFDETNRKFVAKSKKEEACLLLWGQTTVSAINKKYNSDVWFKTKIPQSAEEVRKADYQEIEDTARELAINRLNSNYESAMNELIRKEQSNLRQQQAYNASMVQASQQISNAFTSQYQPASAYSPPKQVDYTCLNECLKGNYMYQFCQSKCEY